MVVKLQINHRFCQVVGVKTPNVAQLFDQTPMLAPIFSHVLSLLMVQQFNSSTLNNILQHVMSPQSHHSKMPKKHTSEGPCYSASVLPRSSPESSWWIFGFNPSRLDMTGSCAYVCPPACLIMFGFRTHYLHAQSQLLSVPIMSMAISGPDWLEVPTI